MDDLCSLPAHELVRLMSDGTVPCRDVMQAHLARIELVNPGSTRWSKPRIRNGARIGRRRRDLKDPFTAPVPLGNPQDVDVGGLRMCTYLDDGISPPDDDVAAVVSAAAAAVGAIDRPAPPCVRNTMNLLRGSVFLGGDRGEKFEADLRAIGETDPSEELAEFLRQARLVEFSLTEARRRFAEIDEYRIAMLEYMADYDVIVCPAMPDTGQTSPPWPG